MGNAYQYRLSVSADKKAHIAQNVNCSPKCESNSEKKVQNNAFWMILASKAMFNDQQSTVQMWKSIKKSFRFSNF